MNSLNSKPHEPGSLLLDLSDKINLKKSKKMFLSNHSMYYTWKNIKKSHKNSEFKISASTWNERFGLPDGSCSVLDMQDYFEYFIKKDQTVNYNLPVRIYVTEIENSVTFKIKTGYDLELLKSEIMKLLGSTKRKKTKNENSDNVPHLEITEVYY